MTAGRVNIQTRDWDDVGAAREAGVIPQSTEISGGELAPLPGIPHAQRESQDPTDRRI